MVEEWDGMVKESRQSSISYSCCHGQRERDAGTRPVTWHQQQKRKRFSALKKGKRGSLAGGCPKHGINSMSTGRNRDCFSKGIHDKGCIQGVLHPREKIRGGCFPFLVAKRTAMSGHLCTLPYLPDMMDVLDRLPFYKGCYRHFAVSLF